MALQSLWPHTIIWRISLTTHPSSSAAGSQLKYSSWKCWAWGIRLPAFRTKKIWKHFDQIKSICTCNKLVHFRNKPLLLPNIGRSKQILLKSDNISRIACSKNKYLRTSPNYYNLLLVFTSLNWIKSHALVRNSCNLSMPFKNTRLLRYNLKICIAHSTSANNDSESKI